MQELVPVWPRNESSWGCSRKRLEKERTESVFHFHPDPDRVQFQPLTVHSAMGCGQPAMFRISHVEAFSWEHGRPGQTRTGTTACLRQILNHTTLTSAVISNFKCYAYPSAAPNAATMQFSPQRWSASRPYLFEVISRMRWLYFFKDEINNKPANMIINTRGLLL